MDHERGTDPTPQGRHHETVRRTTQTPPNGYESEKYENSTPGPEVREDGVYFLGYKRENANQPPVEKG